MATIELLKFAIDKFNEMLNIVVMKLSDYLISKDLNRSEFARLISVTPQAVDQWVNGERFPRTQYLQRISEITKGKVTANDFLPEQSC